MIRSQHRTHTIRQKTDSITFFFANLKLWPPNLAAVLRLLQSRIPVYGSIPSRPLWSYSMLVKLSSYRCPTTILDGGEQQFTSLQIAKHNPSRYAIFGENDLGNSLQYNIQSTSGWIIDGASWYAGLNITPVLPVYWTCQRRPSDFELLVAIFRVKHSLFPVPKLLTSEHQLLDAHMTAKPKPRITTRQTTDDRRQTTDDRRQSMRANLGKSWMFVQPWGVFSALQWSFIILISFYFEMRGNGRGPSIQKACSPRNDPKKLITEQIGQERRKWPALTLYWYWSEHW